MGGIPSKKTKGDGMKKKKEVTIKLDEMTEELKFVGKGLYARKTGATIEIYKRHWSVNPKQTLAMIVFFSVLLGIGIGGLLWY